MQKYILLLIITLSFSPLVLSSDCLKKDSMTSCLMTNGCCWVDGNVIGLGEVKLCTAPILGWDSSDFCKNVKKDAVVGYEDVKSCYCSNWKFDLVMILLLVIICGLLFGCFRVIKRKLRKRGSLLH